MITYTETLKLPLAANHLLSHLQSITIQLYKPLVCDYTHSYELQTLPDFRLMEGAIVPPHSDGIAGYRPILMLHNPSNSYTIRGTEQIFSPQRQGTLVILDIDAQHEVHSKDPNARLGNWSGVVWGLNGQPLLKDEWSVEQVTAMAKQDFLKLCETIHGKLKPSNIASTPRNAMAIC
ncbi:hypothetical protein [Leptothoe sp. PORK10 BA2]|uniref:hypothetical protein n=1 Tax=Leptothoe sp. PORK10 BA2 TaxID=3110254 RepID=UPI002B21AF95|nr:hypothetical protein [Leptothoe sp. PORK10 BA2]MEA5466216.1 hypothetical protein [Leptothoe sp. PORK10 BA2]